MGLPEIMDKQIDSGNFPAFIVVMPYDPGWDDPNVGKYDKAISESLVKWINSEYSVKKERAYRAIGGVSRGSAWAFHIAYKYPELFSIVGIHSPAFFRADRRSMEAILEKLSDRSKIHILLDVGLQDPELNYSRRFEEFLTKYEIEHTWLVQDGSHSEAYWRQNLEYYLEEYSKNW
jgi:enterochelin esterase-like enzyme